MRTILPVFIAVGLALSAAAATAQEPAQREVKLAIEQQTLADALAQWAQQTGFQLISQVELTTVLTAPRLHGTYSAQGALDRLLEGTSLTYVWLNERTVAVRSRPPAVDQRSSTSVGADASRLRFANLQAEDSPRFQRVAQVGSPTTRSEGIPEVRLSEEILDEVVVTGSRLKRGRDDGPAPVITFDSARIGQLGVTTVADVLDYLPQQPFTLREAGVFDGRRIVRLRGLGVGTTLVLINGRRTVTSALASSSNVFDLNSLPMSAVERIEVLSDSASAVYGADAVGGVVNVILKSHVDQPAIDLYYGAADGGAEETHGSLSFGGETGRFRGLVVLDGFDRQGLLGSEREFYANQDFRRFGGADLRSATANPGNVTSLFPGNLPGLNAPFAAVPAGSDGVGLTPADFAATAGARNLESITKYASVVPESQRYGAWTTAEFDLTDSMALFGEFMYSQREGVLEAGKPPLPGFPVFPSNPFNPFGVPVLVDLLFTDLPSIESRTESDTTRAVLGFKTAIRSWDAEISVLGTRDNGKVGTYNAPDYARIFAALQSPDPAQALNPFVDGPPGSPELLRSFAGVPIINRSQSEALQWSGFTRGSLFTLPAGDVQALIGAEARKENLHFEQRPQTETLDTDRKTYAVYSEARVPIVGRDSGAGRWVGTVAARYDHYDDFGGSFNPQFGLEWSPVDSMLIRSSYGTSFKPPSLWNLHQPTGTFPGSFINDPLRNNELAVVDLIIAGNPQLEPEEANSWTLGVVFQPSNGLRASVTYWEVEQTERIQQLPSNLVLLNPDQFGDLIVRDTPTPADDAAGLPGRLLGITSTSVNFGRLKTSGIDAELQQSFSTKVGVFSPSIMATWLGKFSSADLPGLPAVERVGIASANQGTLPRWRASGAIAWEYGAVALSATARYNSHYADTTLAGVKTGRTVPATTIVDLQAVIDLGEAFTTRAALLRNFKVRAGAINAFDEEPHFAEVGGSFGFDLTQSDARQRMLYISLSKAF